MAYYTAKDFPGINWQNTQGYNPIQMPSWEARVLEDSLLGDEEDDTTTGVVQDSSGEVWVLGPDGRYYPVNSDYGQALLGDARIYNPSMYDSSGAFVGSETLGEKLNVKWGGGPFSTTEWETSDLDPIAVQQAALDEYNETQAPEDKVFIDEAGNRYREVTNPYTGKTERIGMGNRKHGLKAATGFVNFMRKGGPFATIKTLANMLKKPTTKDTVAKQNLKHTTTTPSLTVQDEATPFAYPAGYEPDPVDMASVMYPDMPGYDPEEIWGFEDKVPMRIGPSQYQQGLMYDDPVQSALGLLGPYAIANNMLEYAGQHPIGAVPANYVDEYAMNTPDQAAGWARYNAVQPALYDTSTATESNFNWAGSSPVVEVNTGAVDDDEDDEAYAGMLDTTQGIQ